MSHQVKVDGNVFDANEAGEYIIECVLVLCGCAKVVTLEGSLK